MERYFKNKLRGFTCPNISLFRFINEINFKFKNKKILELGFGHGSDLVEVKRRGAIAYGIDINPYAIEKLRKKNIKVKLQDLSLGKILFKKVMFDLIYHQDVSCYMSDYEICLLNENVFNNLKKNGIYIFQFIEQDLKLKKKKYSAFLEIKKNYIENPFHEKGNPINFKSLKKILKLFEKNNLKFKLIKNKLTLETYANDENNLRVKRYLMFKKV